MNRSLSLLTLLTSTAALLAGCGGGGDDPAPAPAPAPSAPVAPAPPAPAGAATEANARRLAAEAHAAIGAAEQRALLPGLPGGVVVNTPCPGGGNIVYDYPDTFAAGTTYTVSYNNCSYGSGTLFNGTYRITYANVTSPTNFAFTVTYDLRYIGPGIDYTYAGTQTCSSGTGTLSCTYSDGRRTWGSGFTYTGGRLSGSYSWSDETLGTVTYTFDGFTATGGTVTVTGTGLAATITRTGANTYSVVINGSAPFVVTITG